MLTKNKQLDKKKEKKKKNGVKDIFCKFKIKTV